MGNHRRMFSRRTVAGLLFGIAIGFNLASWLSMPVPTHTDIEIELIAGSRESAEGYRNFRLGAARVRRNNKISFLKSGKDCNDEDVDYRNEENSIINRQNQENNLNDRVDDDGGKQNFNYEVLKEFELEEERRRRQKELERFYESDAGEEEDNFYDDSDMLEDFQYPVNVKKYDDYETEMTSQSDKQKSFGKKTKELLENSFVDFNQNQFSFPHDQNHFLYVGILTAEKYLATRGRAIMDTWAKRVPGKLEFYVGEGVKNINDGGQPLPLVMLEKVKDDAYPPQKKSFLLLKNMYDSYLNSGYQWFMRADDDVYVKTEKLEKFLRTLNSSAPIFLGQTGLGNAEERGRLSLPHGDNYCMGGPGMIFSREVLRRVGPHIRNCVRFLFSWHEDVELSRCIRRYADVNCAWSYQMQELFYEHYTLRKGYIDPYQDPTNRKLYSAFTLHPNKNPYYQVKLHKFFQSQKLQHLTTHVKELSRDILKINGYLNTISSMEDFMLGIEPSLHRFVPRNRNETIPWSFMTERLWYAHPPLPPRRTISSVKQIAVKELTLRIMQSMNANSKVRGRVIEFKHVAYGYHRVNPLYGAEYVLDLLLLYRRFRGKPISIPVRRHAYLQQTFSRTVLHETTELDVLAITSAVRNLKPGLIGSMTMMFKSGFQRAGKMIGFGGEKNSDKSSTNHVMSKLFKNVIHIDSVKLSSLRQVNSNKVSNVNIIIPLKGRHETFRTFMLHLEKVCLSQNDPISLFIVLFASKDSVGMKEDKQTTELLDTYASRYPRYSLRLVSINGVFSRGLGLEIGASYFSSNSLLFFCDIDVVFDENFTQKCRANTVNGSRVYYPVLFSQYHPNFENVESFRGEHVDPLSNLNKLQNMSFVRQYQKDQDHFEIADFRGFWRNFGFGLLCTYKGDFSKSGGFDTTIQGWGMEDVDLIDKYIAGEGNERESGTRHRFDIFRATEPSLVHIYHTSHCDSNLTENQLRMCRASRASSISSLNNLARTWNDFQGHNEAYPAVVDPVSEILPDHQDEEEEDDDDVEIKNIKLENYSEKKRIKRNLKNYAKQGRVT